MAKARNIVIAGDYEKSCISKPFNGTAAILVSTGFLKVKSIPLNSETVESYEIIADDSNKSMSSAVMRSVVGGAVLGPAGAIAGGMTAKSNKIHQVSVCFKDGKRSLLEIDNEVYNMIVKKCF